MVKMYRVAKKAQKELITRAMLGEGEDGWEGGAAVKRSGEFGRDGGGEGDGCVAVFKGKRRGGGCSWWKGARRARGRSKHWR